MIKTLEKKNELYDIFTNRFEPTIKNILAFKVDLMHQPCS